MALGFAYAVGSGDAQVKTKVWSILKAVEVCVM